MEVYLAGKENMKEGGEVRKKEERGGGEARKRGRGRRSGQGRWREENGRKGEKWRVFPTYPRAQYCGALLVLPKRALGHVYTHEAPYAHTMPQP